MICVWPRVKSAEPCVRGLTCTSPRRADLLLGATVRTALVDRDLLADEVLVDRLERALDELLRRRVLDAGSPSAGSPPTGNGSSSSSRMRLRRRSRFADLSSFESCSASVSSRRSRNCSRTALDRGERLLEDRGEARADLRPLRHVVLGRGHRDRWREALDELLDDRPASLRPCPAIAVRTASPCAASSSAVRSTSTHFALPTCSRSSRAPQILRISACASSSASRIVSSGTWSPRPRPSSAPRRADDDEVERRLLELLERRVEDELVLEPPMRTAPIGPRNGSGEIISAPRPR